MRKIPTWSEYFMMIAETAALRSKDPNTQVGCCIVSKENRVLGLGYNGMPEDYDESSDLWKPLTKYDHVCHAELNAILNCSIPPKNAKLFVTLYPCKNCAKLIAAARIKKVYYKHSTLKDKDYFDPVSKDIFKRARITITRVKNDS